MNDDNLLTNRFLIAINQWEAALEKYNHAQLLAKPTVKSWSVGQVYMHVIYASRYFLKQVSICTASNDNMLQKASPAAKEIFANNSLPDKILEGPPDNENTPQPVDKNDIVLRLAALKTLLSQADGLMRSIEACNGKTKHSGLGYFDAAQWLQFACIHWRHHNRQISRIEAYLKEQENIGF